MANAAGAVPNAVGITSRRLAMVLSYSPGSGLPSSIYIVPPRRMMRLNAALPAMV